MSFINDPPVVLQPLFKYVKLPQCLKPQHWLGTHKLCPYQSGIAAKQPQMALEMSFLKILLFLSILRSTQGTDYKYPFVKEASTFSQEQENHHYDYIIVGGGTAGCPLAATLSQNFSVLLLERGGSPYGNINISWMQNFHISLADTSPTSPSQVFVSTDGVINARARVLGGGTAINAGFYTRASPKFVDEAGWEGELVNQSYPWIEKQIVHWPELAPWQVALRDGLLEAGVSPFNGYTYEHVYGTKVGGTIFDKNGFRHTAADLLASANPANLRVLLRATVKRIIFGFHGRGKRPTAIGVNFKDENGKEKQVFVRKSRKSEVILCAGAIGSPQLLLLSGIGPRDELESMKIPSVVDRKFVGKGMSDNPMNSIYIPTKRTVEQSLIQIVGITKMGSYIEASSGFGQSSDSILLSNHGLMSAEIGQLSTLPPKQRSLQAMSDYSRNKRKLPREAFMGGFILEKIIGPLSNGPLSLLTLDVDDNPSVTFNYFSDPRDLRRCVSGIRTIERIVRSRHITDLTEDDKYTMERLLNMSVKANINLIPKHTNDTSSLEQFCRDTVVTIWHYHGSCKVGKVVKRDYRVFGVNNLRVVDGSTFVNSPGTNPQATVMMLGRYVGVKLLRERLGKAAAAV